MHVSGSGAPPHGALFTAAQKKKSPFVRISKTPVLDPNQLLVVLQGSSCCEICCSLAPDKAARHLAHKAHPAKERGGVHCLPTGSRKIRVFQINIRTKKNKHEYSSVLHLHPLCAPPLHLTPETHRKPSVQTLMALQFSSEIET